MTLEQNSSSRLKAKFWAFLVLALVLIGAGVYVYNYMTAEASQPPSLTPATNLQGMMKVGKWTVYDGSDVAGYKYKDCSSENKKNMKYGLHYFTTTSATTFGDFYNKIQPVDGEWVLIASWNVTQEKWTMYPETDYYVKDNINFVKDADLLATPIKAFTTVVVVNGVSNGENDVAGTFICDGSLVTENDKIVSGSLLGAGDSKKLDYFVMNYMLKTEEISSGWHLFPYGTDVKLFSVLNDGFASKIDSVWIDSTGESAWKEVSLGDLISEKETIGSNVMVWVDLKNKVVKDDLLNGLVSAATTEFKDSERDNAKKLFKIMFGAVILDGGKLITPELWVDIKWTDDVANEFAVDFGQDKAGLIGDRSGFASSDDVLKGFFTLKDSKGADVKINEVWFSEKLTGGVIRFGLATELKAGEVYRLFLSKDLGSSDDGSDSSYIEFDPAKGTTWAQAMKALAEEAKSEDEEEDVGEEDDLAKSACLNGEGCENNENCVTKFKINDSEYPALDNVCVSKSLNKNDFVDVCRGVSTENKSDVVPTGGSFYSLGSISPDFGINCDVATAEEPDVTDGDGSDISASACGNTCADGEVCVKGVLYDGVVGLASGVDDVICLPEDFS